MVVELSFINLFRALAAFWVLFAHCMIWGGWYGIPVPSAKIAVDLFMVISGFLMAANAHARSSREPLSESINWVKFWTRRFFRIAPAYYLSLLIAIVLGKHFLGGYSALQELNPEAWGSGGVYDPQRISYTFKNIIYHITFVFGLHPYYSFSTFLPDWSLSLEMQFYFAFPALWILLRRFGLSYAALLVGIGAFLVGVEVSRRIPFYEPSLLLFKINYFIAGIVLHRALYEPRAAKRLFYVGISVVLCALDWRYGRELMVLPSLVLLMSYLGIMEVKGRSPQIISRLMNGKGVHFASNASYGVYLFHGFFISAAGLIIKSSPALRSVSAPVRVLLIIIFVLPLAYVTAHYVFKWIEKPGVDMGKRALAILDRKRSASTET
ncbi:acyltransferase [Tibeticola sp.]|uniref:acyltransferase family protein n=1 Tax=Tibeticola sp. TaxID=2005368 RepID=UPI0025D30D90|nr:acyltransferase [Tibeticola sp.]